MLGCKISMGQTQEPTSRVSESEVIGMFMPGTTGIDGQRLLPTIVSAFRGCGSEATEMFMLGAGGRNVSDWKRTVSLAVPIAHIARSAPHVDLPTKMHLLQIQSVATPQGTSKPSSTSCASRFRASTTRTKEVHGNRCSEHPYKSTDIYCTLQLQGAFVGIEGFERKRIGCKNAMGTTHTHTHTSV